MKHAILDAYENVAPVIADWSGIRRHPAKSLCSTTTLPIPRQSSNGCGHSTRRAG